MYLQLEWLKLFSLTEYWLSLCALYYSHAKTEMYTVQHTYSLHVLGHVNGCNCIII